MKKLIRIVAIAFMCADMAITNEPQEVVDTIELPQEEITTEYLTEQDFSLLYTCKEYEPPTNTNIVEVSEYEAQLLMKIAHAEDATDAKSQAYIMSVIINRVNSEDFPDTVEEVINQTGQFSPVDDGRFQSSEPDINSHEALFLIESGQIKTDYLYFEALTLKDSWQSDRKSVV